MLWIDTLGRVWETRKVPQGYLARTVENGRNGSLYSSWELLDIATMARLGFFKVP